MLSRESPEWAFKKTEVEGSGGRVAYKWQTYSFWQTWSRVTILVKSVDILISFSTLKPY